MRNYVRTQINLRPEMAQAICDHIYNLGASVSEYDDEVGIQLIAIGEQIQAAIDRRDEAEAKKNDEAEVRQKG